MQIIKTKCHRLTDFNAEILYEIINDIVEEANEKFSCCFKIVSQCHTVQFIQASHESKRHRALSHIPGDYPSDEYLFSIVLILDNSL